MFNRLIYVRPSGLIVNSARLDRLFTVAIGSEIQGISTKHGGKDSDPQVLVLEPSAKAFNQSLSMIEVGKYKEDKFLQSIPRANATNSNQSHSITETSAIHLESEDGFSLLRFIDETSYVHISDPGMPGPEFSSSRSRIFRAQPESVQLREIWEAIYERYRQQRMEVCGLDLEPEPEITESKPTQSRPKKLRIDISNEEVLSIRTEAG